MSKVIITLLTVLSISISFLADSYEYKSNEYPKIERLINAYFQVFLIGDKNKVIESFDESIADVRELVIDKNGQQHIKIHRLSDYFKGITSPVAIAKTAKILKVDVVNNDMAYVKVSFDMSRNRRLIDYLMLYKINNQWKIVTKMFSVEPNK